ncbi:LacI family DNA-binding transcriptional regulator [Mariniluteicoccus endophyticus]
MKLGATITDVAERAGVSRATASRVLGGYGYASDSVRQRVLEAAAALDYQPNRVARSMRSGRTHMVGFVCGDISDGVFSAAMRGICDVMEAAEYQVLLVNSDERLTEEQSGIQALMSHGVEGIIVSPVLTGRPEHLTAVAESTPLVAFDRELSGVPGVVADNREAARKAVGRAVELGHVEIGLIGSIQPKEPVSLNQREGGLEFGGARRPSTARAQGYQDALKAAGHDVKPERVLFLDFAAPDEVDGLRTLLDNGVTAFFTADSYQTLATYRALQQLGVRVPEDVSLFGFSDADWPALVRPGVSVVRQDAYEMGRRSAEALLTLIAGGDVPDQIVVPTVHEPRASLAVRL